MLSGGIGAKGRGISMSVVSFCRGAATYVAHPNHMPRRFFSHDAYRPLRMAIIGSGPAGFYTASGVLGARAPVKVDLYESLPVPFGLTRFGFAPDHPEIPETSQAKWTKLAETPDFQFLGNVSIGAADVDSRPESCHISLETLMRHYDIVTFAYGASEDRTLDVPGESLHGVYSARQFVAWYNGLPSNSPFTPDLAAGDEAVIIGQGNVAIDVARILLKSPDQLKSTDISDEALAALSRNRLKKVRIVGRRGPAQAKFTRAELRGLLKLPGVAMHSLHPSDIPNSVLHANLPSNRANIGRMARLVRTMVKGSTTPVHEATKTWSLDFCLAPHEFLASEKKAFCVERTTFRRTKLSAEDDALANVSLTDDFHTFKSSLVFRSVGYKSVPLKGFEDAGIAFDQGRGVIRTDGNGRVLASGASTPIPGLYCAGWLNSGATGVIGDTMVQSHLTAAAIVKDITSMASLLPRTGRYSNQGAAGWEGVKADTPSSRLGRVVTWDDWKTIDGVELERGRSVGKRRRKFLTTEEMLAVLR